MATAEDLEYLKERDINIDQTQPGHRSAEGGFIPKVLETGDNRLKEVQVPGVGPRKDHQKQAYLEGKQSEADPQ